MMFQQPWYFVILSALPMLLVHLAGIVVAIILLVRRRSTPAILALIGFGVLFIVSLAGLGRSPLIGWLTRRAIGIQFWRINAGVGCCCSILDMAAIVCLIVALWQAVSATGGGGMEEVTGEFVDVSEEAVEEGE